MTLFRIFLVATLGVITVYTGVVIANHGLNLFPAFFGGMPFLCIYLLYLLSRTGGDMRRVLLGDARA